MTSDILWDVTKETLQEEGFDKIQIMRFSKARKAQEEINSMKIGTYWNIFIIHKQFFGKIEILKVKCIFV